MIYKNTNNINEAFNRNGQSAAFCDRFLRFSHKTTLCCLIKDYHIRTINIMVQAATFFMLGIAMVVVVFVAFDVATLDGSIFGVTHTPAAPKFELFVRTSSIRSSNFLRTKFEEVRRKSSNMLFEELRTFSNRTKKKNVLEFIRFLPNFPIFRKKKRTFPEVPVMERRRTGS
jgi:hypothetical protein